MNEKGKKKIDLKFNTLGYRSDKPNTVERIKRHKNTLINENKSRRKSDLKQSIDLNSARAID